MKILSVKDNPPETDMRCIVWNEKGWMYEIKAFYYKNYDIFVLRDGSYNDALTLDVTHYMHIPEFSTNE